MSSIKPHIACLKRKIPVIAVKENTAYLNDEMPEEFMIIVDSYLDATVLLVAMKMGIAPESVRCPLDYTTVHTSKEKIILPTLRLWDRL